MYEDIENGSNLKDKLYWSFLSWMIVYALTNHMKKKNKLDLINKLVFNPHAFLNDEYL